MANLVIRDLEINEELDRKAMDMLAGGFWGWGYQHHSSSAFGFGPFGGWGYHHSSTSFGWGGFWW